MLMVISAASACTGKMTTIGVGHNPAVYNNMVAWSDDTSGYGGNIHVYDLSAKKDTAINTSSAFYPAIYGNKLVWNDQSQGMPLIAVYDLKSKNSSYISQNAETSSIPKIYGNIIVWSANNAVYMYDLSKSTETTIGTGTNPDIDGTKISYTNDSAFSMLFGTAASTVNVYDISSKTTVACGSGDNSHIYGGKVAWLTSDMTSGQNTLVMYDLSTKKMTNITTSNVGSFDIYGDNIAYVNTSDSTGMGIIGMGMGSTGGIPYVYSISKGRATSIPGETQCGNIAIYGNNIVWDSSASSNITAYQLASTSSSSTVAKPCAAFKADKVSGKHPLAVTFTYTGTGGAPDSCTWNFGDNTKAVTTTAKTVKHTFAKAGKYTVSVIAKNKAGSSTGTKSKYITIK
jgi:beta propeller repeat protein